MQELMKSQAYTYVCVPVVNMRASPCDQAEVLSQGLFSEAIRCVETQGAWTKVITAIDRYEGWVTNSAICSRSTPFSTVEDSFSVQVTRLAAHLYAVEDTIYGPVLTLPFESRLQLLAPYAADDSRWLKVALPDGKQSYIQRGDITKQLQKLDCTAMCTLSRSFLGLPYTWGGRSSFGYDCSGFIQMLYRQMGILLPRDSIDQCHSSLFIETSIEKLTPGDLIFFGFGIDKIRHVGMYLERGSFIHTAAVVENAPYVRISHVDDHEWCGRGYYPFRTARRLK